MESIDKLVVLKGTNINGERGVITNFVKVGTREKYLVRWPNNEETLHPMKDLWVVPANSATNTSTEPIINVSPSNFVLETSMEPNATILLKKKTKTNKK